MTHGAVTLLAISVLTTPALAWQEPKPVANNSPICTVKYDPNEGVNLTMAPSVTLTVELGDNRTIEDVAVSNKEDLSRAKKANVLWLKAVNPMPAQPISVRAVREDGKAELYILQWTAETPDQRVCDLVRFVYPGDAADKARAEAAKRREEWQANQAAISMRIAARLPTAASVVNRSYIISGASDLLPRQMAPVSGTGAVQIGAR